MAEIKSCLVPSPYKEEFSDSKSRPHYVNLALELRRQNLPDLPIYQSNLTNLDKSGSVVVMIGGLLETSTIWTRYQDKLNAEGIPWISISLPGFDGRAESGKDFTAEKSIQIVLSKLNQLGENRKAGCSDKIKTFLVGHSLGANVAFDVSGKNISGLEIVETHLLNPAINALDSQLKLLSASYKAASSFKSFGAIRPGEDSRNNFCRNMLPIADRAVREMSIGQYMKSPRAHLSDAPPDVFFSSPTLPLTAACEAVRMAKTMEENVKVRFVNSKAENIFIYESTGDALLEPGKLNQYISTTTFSDASHFLPTNREGLDFILPAVIARAKKK